MVVNNNAKLKYVLINTIITNGLIKILPTNKFNKFKNSIKLRLLNK